MPTLRLDVSGFEHLIEQAQIAEGELSGIIERAVYYLEGLALKIATEEFIKAAAEAGEEAFPKEYLYGILDVLPSIIEPTGDALNLDFDALGTYADLSTAFHYGATLAGGGKVDLPWHGEALKNDDVEKRYEFWTYVFSGTTYRNIPTAGLWPETIRARVDQWNSLGKAPQWLFLEFGQEEWEPMIDSYPLIENITELVQEAWLSILEGELQALVNQFNQEGSSFLGSHYDPRGRGSKLRDSSGRFTSLQNLSEE